MFPAMTGTQHKWTAIDRCVGVSGRHTHVVDVVVKLTQGKEHQEHWVSCWCNGVLLGARLTPILRSTLSSSYLCLYTCPLLLGKLFTFYSAGVANTHTKTNTCILYFRGYKCLFLPDLNLTAGFYIYRIKSIGNQTVIQHRNTLGSLQKLHGKLPRDVLKSK